MAGRLKKIAGILLISILLPAAYLMLRPDQTRTTAELRAIYETPHSAYCAWRGGKVHYTDRGDGLPVLFIHGFGASFKNWDAAVDSFPAGFRLVRVDLPGFGLSDAPVKEPGENFITMYVDAVSTVIRHLDLDSVNLVGNSMGGYVSWEMAIRYPELVGKLVLVDAAGYQLEEIGGTFINLSRTRFYKWVSRKGVPYRLARIMASRSVAHRPERERVEIMHDLLNRKETIETVSMLGQSGESADTSRITGIRHPTLIVWGDADHVIPVDHAYRFLRDIPHADLVIYPLIGHVPQVENPGRFTRDVSAFLAGDPVPFK